MFKKLSSLVLALVLTLSVMLVASCKPKVTLSAKGEVEAYLGDEVNFDLKVTSKKVSAEDVLANLDYSSSVDNFIKIENGKVIANKLGTATITISWKENKDIKAVVELTIVNRPVEIKFNEVPAELGIGDTFTFVCQTEGATVSYSVDDEAKASLSDATLTAKAAGKVKVTASITYEGKEIEKSFEINIVDYSITITYENCEGATNPNPTKLDSRKLPYTLEAATLNGKTFAGWFSDAELNQEVKVIAKDSSDTTLYAKWVVNQKTSGIYYKLDGGTLPEGAPKTYVEGVGVTLPIPTKEGYVFLGWSLIKGGSKYITEISAEQKHDVFVYANWERPTWNIEYVLNGGTLPEGAVSSYVEGTGVKLPVPTKEGYNFIGWTKTEGGHDYLSQVGTSEKGNLKLYANWEVKPTNVTVTPEFNGGSFSWQAGKVTDPAKGIDQDTDLPEIFMADFYRYLNETGLINSSIIAPAIKAKGKDWASFSKLEGDPQASYNNTSTGGYGAHDGYNQFFWDSLDGEKAVGGFLGTSPYKEKYANLTSLLVRLTKIQYSTISGATFKAGAGFVLDGYFYGTQGLKKSGEQAALFNTLRGFIPTPTKGHDGSKETTNTYEVLEADLGQTITLVEPSKAGHIFLGWYLNPEFNGDPVTSVNKACHVYAKWQDLSKPMPEHKITYVLNGGTLDAPVATYNEWSIVKFPVPTKAKHRFIGWTLVEGGDTFVKQTETNWKQDVTLYANWVEDDAYKITYIYDEGHVPHHEAKDLNEFLDYFWISFYNWTGSDEDFEGFKKRHTDTWAGGDQTEYKLYKGDSKNQMFDGYFVHCKANYDEWMPFLNALDAAITDINPSQSAWGSPWVGHLRLGALIKQSASYWNADRNAMVYKSVPIPTPLISGYKAGDAFDLVPLEVEDGRTFLGWFDESGNQVTKVTADMKQDLVLTARWSEATPVEGFDITNKIDRILRLTEHQLEWTFTPANATNKKLKFSSDNKEILEVTEEGLLIAHHEGNAKITVEVLGNPSLNVVLNIEVYVEDFIDGSYQTDTYVEPENTIQLNASLHSKNPGTILWKSLNPEIATVNENGIVTGVKPGYANIMAYVKDNEAINLTFGVTIISLADSKFFGTITKAHNPEIFVNHDLNVAYTYLTDVLGSANDLLFNYDYKITDMLNAPGHPCRPGTKISNMEFITVHYTAGTPASSNGANTARYFNGTDAASANFCVGNDGIFRVIPEGEVAYHAGDGTRVQFAWLKTGVKASGNVQPKIACVRDSSVSSGWVFTVNGQKTPVEVPTTGKRSNGEYATMKDPNNNLTFFGPRWTVKNGEYYLGNTWACFTQTWEGAVSSYGGNLNSVGIETACNKGSDLMLTYQITAQLVAKLLHQYGLDTTRVTGHNNFSGKDCPQTLLANNGYLWYRFMECVEAEYEAIDTMKGYKVSCKSNNPDILSDNGRLIKQPDYTQVVSYTVTVQDQNGVTKTATYSSVVHGRYTE